VDAAVESFKAFGEKPLSHFSCRELLWLGRAAASLDENQMAAEALLGAAHSKGHEIDVVKARMLLAKLLDERLSRKQEARDMMELIVSEHADSDAGKVARKWLQEQACVDSD